MQTHYLFDFDGTLVDSMPVWAGAHIQMLTDAGIAVPPDFVKTITPLGNVGAAHYTISLGLHISPDAYLQKISRTFVQKYAIEVALKPHVAEMLKRLKAAGCKLHVLTASPHLYVDDCLKRHGIFELFQNVWTVDDFGISKADPAIYKEAAARLGVAPAECTMLDDNLVAIATAKQAGLATVAVYDDSAREFENDMRKTADRYIHDFSEL